MYSSSKANLWIVTIKQSNSTSSNAADGAQTAQMLPIRNQTWSKWQQKVATRCQDVCERSQNSSNILQDDSEMSPKVFQTHTTGLKWPQVDSKSLPNGTQTPQDGPNSRQDGPKMSPRGAHVGSQIGESVKLELFKKRWFSPWFLARRCLQAGQEMTGNAPEAFLDCLEWDLMVLCQFPQILGTLQRGVSNSELLASSRAGPTY